MTFIGGSALACAFVAIVTRRGYPVLLAAAAALPSTAGLFLAGNAVPLFYMLALPVPILLLVGRKQTKGQRLRGRGERALIAFLAWSTFISVVGPVIFRGYEVLAPRAGIDTGVQDQTPLSFTVSNIAQIGYLLLAVCVVFYFVKTKVSPHIVGIGLGIGTGLSSLRYVVERVGWPWPAEVFENSTNVAYVNTQLFGVARLRGVFAEPSELAAFSIAATAYFAFLVTRPGITGRLRFTALVLAGAALFNLIASASGTALVAAVVVALLVVLYVMKKLAQGTGALAITATFGGIAVAIGLLLYGGQLFSVVNTVLNEKLGSSSFLNRNTSNELSWQTMLESFGLGVGLGSNRPSSFALMLLSCVGVVGTTLFAVFLIRTLRSAGADPTAVPAIWAVLAILVAKVVAAPDLSTPVMWIAIAAVASVAWNRVTISDREIRALTRTARRERFPISV